MRVLSSKNSELILFSGFTTLISLSLIAVLPAFSQGIGEYGGVMGMPRNIPTSHSRKTLNNLYGGAARNMSKAAGGSSKSKGSSSYYKKGSAGKYGTSTKLGTVMKLGQKAQADLISARKAAKEENFDKAADLYRSSLSIRERYWSGRDKATPEIYKELAEVYAKQKKLNDAEKALKGSIAAYARIHGPGSKHTAVPLKSLGDIYHEQGEDWKSHDHYLQSFMLTERYVGEKSKEAMDLRLKMATKAKDLKKYRRSASFYSKALNIDDEHGILPAKRKIKLLTDYAEVLKTLKKPEEALKLEDYAKSLELPGKPAVQAKKK